MVHILLAESVEMEINTFGESIDYCIAILLAERIGYCVRYFLEGKVLSIVLLFKKNVLSETLSPTSSLPEDATKVCTNLECFLCAQWPLWQ